MNRSKHPRSVPIREVGPRYGPQNEAPLPVCDSVRLSNVNRAIDLVHMLMGVQAGIDLDALIACVSLAPDLVSHELPGQVMGLGPRGKATERIKI